MGDIIMCVFTVLYYLPPSYLHYYPFLYYQLLNESILILLLKYRLFIFIEVSYNLLDTLTRIMYSVTYMYS